MIFLIPVVMLGLFVALIVWLSQLLLPPARPVTA